LLASKLIDTSDLTSKLFGSKGVVGVIIVLATNADESDPGALSLVISIVDGYICLGQVTPLLAGFIAT